MWFHGRNKGFKVLGYHPDVVLELKISPKPCVFVFSSVKWVLVKVHEIRYMKEPDTWQASAQEMRLPFLFLSIPEGDLNNQVIFYMTCENVISESSGITSFL